MATFNPFTVIRPKRKTKNKGEKKKKGSAQMVRIARLLQALSNSLASNLHSFVRQLVILPSACQETHNRFIVPVNKSFRSSQTYYRLMQREREPPDPTLPSVSSHEPLVSKHRQGAQSSAALLRPESIHAKYTSED